MTVTVFATALSMLLATMFAVYAPPPAGVEGEAYVYSGTVLEDSVLSSSLILRCQGCVAATILEVNGTLVGAVAGFRPGQSGIVVRTPVLSYENYVFESPGLGAGSVGFTANLAKGSHVRLIWAADYEFRPDVTEVPGISFTIEKTTWLYASNATAYAHAVSGSVGLAGLLHWETTKPSIGMFMSWFPIQTHVVAAFSTPSRTTFCVQPCPISFQSEPGSHAFLFAGSVSSFVGGGPTTTAPAHIPLGFYVEL